LIVSLSIFFFDFEERDDFHLHVGETVVLLSKLFLRAMQQSIDSQVQELKSHGNREYSSGNYVEAIELFSQAILLDNKNEILYCNRSMAYSSLEQWKDALKDAQIVSTIHFPIPSLSSLIFSRLLNYLRSMKKHIFV
jgi:tetratricopeptide (TPR) repeat protein